MKHPGLKQTKDTNSAVLHSAYGLSALQVLIAAIQTDLDNGTDGLGALKALLDAIPTTMRGTDDAALATVLGALATAAHTGAVDDATAAMGYIKQLVTAIQLIPTTAMRGTENAALASVLGALNNAAATGAVSDGKTQMSYLKQAITRLEEIVIDVTGINGSSIPAMVGTDSAFLAVDGGALATAAATGAVGTTTTVMGYLKQAITRLEEIVIDVTGINGSSIPAMVGTDGAALASVVGALNTAAATGDVTSADLIMAYVKQLVTNSELLIEHENHTTTIFPEASNLDVVLTAHNDANTWSTWAEIVDTTGTPITLSSKFTSLPGHISAMLVEDTSQDSTVFMVEIAYGSAKTIVGRGRVLTETNKLPTAQVERMRGALIPAGETVYYQAMCETAGSKTLNVHFRYFLHS